jgi:Spy/CpxP family protein refolding chaperone
MDFITQNKWLKRSVLFLAILNIGILAFGAWFAQRMPPFPNEGAHFEQAVHLLKTELGLSPQQIAELELIHADFVLKERKLFDRIHEQRNTMNDAMFNQQIDTTLFYDLARQVTTASYLTEVYRLEQAQKFRKILTPEQDLKFLGMIEEVKIYFKPIDQHKARPPRPDGH